MKSQLFTVKQYADLHEIGKRTLHFYDEIGLFSPAVKKENGYRYYTLSQGAVLEMILTLRELDMSLEDIKRYMEKRTPENFEKLVELKQTQLDSKIRELREIKCLLGIKQEQMNYLNEDLNRIQVVSCKKKNYAVTPVDEKESSNIDAIIRHGKSLPYHLFNMEIGTVNHTDNLHRGSYNQSDAIFSNTGNLKCNHIRPAGDYVRAFHVGDYTDLTFTYIKILEYCKRNGLKVEGHAYETGINELCVMRIEEYVTMIEIKVS